LRHYDTNRKVAGSGPDEENELSSIYLIFQAALSPGVYLASKTSKYQKQKNKVFGEYSPADG
jgi:hypothetical protein